MRRVGLKYSYIHSTTQPLNDLIDLIDLDVIINLMILKFRIDLLLLII